MDRLLFIKVPKTGSTFFEKNFDLRETTIDGVRRQISSVGHSWLYPTQIKGWLDWDYPNQPQGVFRDVMTYDLKPSDRLVTVVRNPFALLFSYFNYDWSWCRKYHNLPRGKYTKEDFQKFVDIYLDRSIVFHAPSLRTSLFSQLKDVEGNWILKDDSIIIRFENLKDEIDKFCNLSNLKLRDNSDTAKNEAKQTKPCEWWEAYRLDQIEKLNKLWKDDLDYFGYSFNDNPTAKKQAKPKVAICFSGYIRDLNKNKSFWKSLIDKYDIDVFASFWDGEVISNDDTIDNFKQIYNPKKLDIENYSSFNESTIQALNNYISPSNSLPPFLYDSCKNLDALSMWYKVWRANLLTKGSGVEYDIIIRARTDTYFTKPIELKLDESLSVPNARVQLSGFPNSDGISDMFAYGSPKIMDYYSTCYLFVMEHINNGHYMIPQEHFLHTHLNKINISLKFMKEGMFITKNWEGGVDSKYCDDMDIDNFINSDFMDINPNKEVKWISDIKNSLKF